MRHITYYEDDRAVSQRCSRFGALSFACGYTRPMPCAYKNRTIQGWQRVIRTKDVKRHELRDGVIWDNGLRWMVGDDAWGGCLQGEQTRTLSALAGSYHNAKTRKLPSISINQLTMFSSQLGRAARVGVQSASVSTCAVSNRTLPLLSSQRQRRLSSSKASCPPNGDSNRSRQQAAPQKPELPSSRPANSRSGASSKSAAGRRNVKAAKDEAFDKLPSVPSTEHLHPQGTFAVYAGEEMIGFANEHLRYHHVVLLQPAPPHQPEHGNPPARRHGRLQQHL